LLAKIYTVKYNMRNLIVIGDSWPAGNELEDQYNDAFPLKIKQALGFDNLINLSEGGASLQHYFLQLKKFYTIRKLYPNDAEYELLVCMTSCVRDLYFDDAGQPMEIIPTDTSKIEFYAKMFNYPETAKVFWYRTVFMLQNWARQNAIKDHYVQMFEVPPMDADYSAMIDFRSIYGGAKTNMAGFLADKVGELYDERGYFLHHGHRVERNSKTHQTYFVSGGNHPNKLGHQEIANEIVKFMSR
jgi:hypothetical protein